MNTLQRELSRRLKLVHVLQAHASILQGQLSRSQRELLNHRNGTDEYLRSLSTYTSDLENHLIPDEKDMKTTETHSTPLGQQAQRHVDRAVHRTLELSILLRALRQERALAHAIVEGKTTTDTIAHMPTYEQVRLAEARRDAYQHSIDSSLENASTGQAHIPQKDTGRTIFLKCPSRLLRDDTPCEDETCPLFNMDARGTLDPEEEDEGTTKYYSVRADLLIDDGTGAQVPMSSVVDSGAAWTALRHSFLARSAPELLKLIQPSRKRFKDAQGRIMAIDGRVPLLYGWGPSN